MIALDENLVIKRNGKELIKVYLNEIYEYVSLGHPDKVADYISPLHFGLN